MRWEPAGVFETSCKIDISLYPYDRQSCYLEFGTWAFTSFQVMFVNKTTWCVYILLYCDWLFKVNLSHSSPRVLTDDYHVSGEWEILETKMETNIFKYDCCPKLIFR